MTCKLENEDFTSPNYKHRMTFKLDDDFTSLKYKHVEFVCSDPKCFYNFDECVGVQSVLLEAWIFD